MEGRAHARETYSSGFETSRMQDDLDLFSKDLISSCHPNPRFLGNYGDSNNTDSIHVGIVGGGLAGLRCADVLLQMGYKVTLLEARERLGGRVVQDVLLDNEVDLGPNWIHGGTLNNPILDLAKETKTPLYPATEDTLVFDTHGIPVHSEKVEKCHEVLWSIISDAFRYSNQEYDQISPHLSLKDFFHERLDENKMDEDDRDLILRMGEVWGSFVGDSWEKQSLKNFWLEECLDGENLYVATSHKAIVSLVAKYACQHAEIKLGTRVTSVHCQESLGERNILVETDKGSHEFNEVVVAVPLGCLKQKHISFHPSLPSTLERSLEQITYSRLEKVYITFPTAYWDSSINLSESTGLSCFAHFLTPMYAQNNPSSWTLEVQSLSSKAIAGPHGRPTLLFTIFGQCATHVTSLIATLDASSQEYFHVLDGFFNPYYALLPGYNPDSINCKPLAILATNWHNDNLAGNGTYTNFMIPEEERNTDLVTNGKSIEAANPPPLEDCFMELRQGLPERGIWFAGEHAAPFVALGTSTGAYWSGEAVGMRIGAAHRGPAKSQSK